MNSDGTGSPSNQANATPSSSGSSGSGGGGGGGSPPPAPTGLVASASSGLVTLRWSSDTGATSYDVLRGTSPNGESTTPIATNVTSLTYGDATVAPGNTYYYEVVGVNTAGAGPVSNEAHATAPTHITASISKSCNGASCTFTSTSTDQGGTISTYSWSVNGGSGSNSTFSHTFSSAGTYTVNLSVEDNTGSSGTASTTVTCTAGRSFFGFFFGGSLSCT